MASQWTASPETAVARRHEPHAACAAFAPTEVLRAHPIFGKLPIKAIEQFASHVIRRRFEQDAVIFARGDAGNGLMAVLHGSVRISVPTLDGREVVLALIQPGEIFGEMALLKGQPRSADATACEDCELMVINRREFLQFVQSDREVAVKLLELLADRLRRTSQQVEELMFMSLPVRLSKLVLRLAHASELNGAPGKLAMTQRDLGQMIGVSRESTNKQLRAWEKRGWVRLKSRTLTILNARALSRIGEDHAILD